MDRMDKPDYDPKYEPSADDKRTVNRVIDRLYKMRYVRDKAYAFFNDRNLIDYIDDSVKRWNGYVPPRDGIAMDWQVRVFNNFTRNVVINFLSKVAMNRPKSKVVATDKQGSQDTMRSHVLEKLLDYSRDHEMGEQKFFHSSLEMVTKGTVIMFEGYRKTPRKIKDITNYDPATGKVEFEKREIYDDNDCYSEVVPLEDFFVGNIWVSDMAKQPDVIWKSIVRKQEAREEFKKYPNWKHVIPGAYTAVSENAPYYRNRSYTEMDVDQVEIIRYFNKSKDEMIILANNVLLYDGPIPFHHKAYPFAVGRFEPFSIDFFYGKSLPDKIQGDQDVLNTLWNSMLDQSLLSIYKPVLTDDPDGELDTLLVPGLVQKVNDINKYKQLELDSPDNSHVQMLQMVAKFAQDNAGGLMGGGATQSPRGGKVTARQSMLAEEQAKVAMGLNTKMIEFFAVQADKLRLKNILQFYTLPSKVESVTGLDTQSFVKTFSRVIRLEDSELTDGTYGTTVIRIAKSKKHMPTRYELDVEEEAASIQGENVEILVFSPDYIRNIDFDVHIVPESSYNQSKSLQQAMGIELYQMLLQNPLVNQQENTRELLQMYEKDPDRFMQQQQPMQLGAGQPQPQQGQGQQLPQMTNQILGRGQQRSLAGVTMQ